MEEGPECCRRAEGSLGPPSAGAGDAALVRYHCCRPAFRHHPPGRTDKNLCRCFGASAAGVFPDHLITYLLLHFVSK